MILARTTGESLKPEGGWQERTVVGSQTLDAAWLIRPTGVKPEGSKLESVAAQSQKIEAG